MSNHSFFDRAILFFCRLEPSGLSPKAPGTFGSLLAIILAPFIFLPLVLPVKIIVLFLLFIVGGCAATKAERLLGKSDPGCIVIDELVGQWVALLPYAILSWWELALAFVFFRVFDIAKPWPVKASETWLPKGFGIMIDDVFAGLYALISLAALRWMLTYFGISA